MAIVASNHQLNADLDAQRTVYNTTAYLVCLFKNNITVDPTTLLANLTEANFTGYARVSTVGNFPNAPARVIDGEYAVMSNLLSYTNTGSSQTVYGWFLTDPSFTNLLFSETLATPFTLTSTGPPLVLQIDLIEWARTVLPP